MLRILTQTLALTMITNPNLIRMPGSCLSFDALTSMPLTQCPYFDTLDAMPLAQCRYPKQGPTAWARRLPPDLLRGIRRVPDPNPNPNPNLSARLGQGYQATPIMVAQP